jgi:hypothetical protein
VALEKAGLVHIPPVARLDWLDPRYLEQREECLDIFSRGTVDASTIHRFTSQGFDFRVPSKKALHPVLSKWLGVAVVDEDALDKLTDLRVGWRNAQGALSKNPIN